MRLDEVRIQNFCSCVSLTIPLNNFNPVIGYNNSGKSNILRAVSWLLRKSVLTVHTFHDPAQAVIVEGRISAVNLNLLPSNQQAQVAPYVSGDNLRFRRRQDAPNVPAAQVRLEVFNPQSGQWVSNPTGLDNAIGVLFPEPLYIEAMDDAGDDISRFSAKNTIGLLLKYAIERIRENNAAALQTVLADLQTIGAHLTGPARLPELGDLETQAAGAIAEFFPDLGLHLEIQAPSLDDLIKGATISLSDQQGHRRPFASFGHGAQRTVQMALIKLLASLANPGGAQGTTTVLLIDEPELYLHPQAIERLRDTLELLSQQNFQVVFSTHSPLMLGSAQVLNASMVYKNALGETVTRTKLAAAANTIGAHPHHANVVFSIQNATYLLFSEKPLIVEGKTETMIVPALYKTLLGRSMAQDKACLIEGSSSSSIWPMMQVLQGVGFGPKAVVDLDFVFKVAPQNQLISATDPDFLLCRTWFATNQAGTGYVLGTDGFPSRKDATGAVASVSPERAFGAMAQGMQVAVANLTAKLRVKGIWVWERGAIEDYLGIQKNDLARMSFISTAQATKNVNHAARPADLASFIAWLQ